MKTPPALHLCQARVATRWVVCGDSSCTPIPEPVLHAVERENRHRRAGLLALLQGSRARNHWRVAVRRYLMLCECGYDVPLEVAAYCEGLVGRMAHGELERTRQAVRLWAAMVARRTLPR